MKTIAFLVNYCTLGRSNLQPGIGNEVPIRLDKTMFEYRNYQHR